jgi:Arc/MetJ-type ribon-helix-helix transcriptional regulator
MPNRYRAGMSTQIAVRLPDEIVAFIDQKVGAKHAPSRAAVVVRALERERRRQLRQHCHDPDRIAQPTHWLPAPSARI